METPLSAVCDTGRGRMRRQEATEGPQFRQKQSARNGGTCGHAPLNPGRVGWANKRAAAQRPRATHETQAGLRVWRRVRRQQEARDWNVSHGNVCTCTQACINVLKHGSPPKRRCEHLRLGEAARSRVSIRYVYETKNDLQ